MGDCPILVLNAAYNEEEGFLYWLIEEPKLSTLPNEKLRLLEDGKTSLAGWVFGHRRFDDGAFVSTSPIVKALAADTAEFNFVAAEVARKEQILKRIAFWKVPKVGTILAAAPGLIVDTTSGMRYEVRIPIWK